MRDDRKSIKPKQEVVLCTDKRGLVPLLGKITSVHERERERETERERERETETETERQRDRETEREKTDRKYGFGLCVPVCSAQAGIEDVHAPAGRNICTDTP